jgi:solute carrier family 25 protein 16
MQVQVSHVTGAGSVENKVKRLEMCGVARLIFAERGFPGFFVGLGIGYIKVVPMFAVTFFVYGHVRRMLGVY